MSVPVLFTSDDRYRFTKAFILVFYVLAAYHWLCGLFLYQLEPVLFHTRYDGTSWLLMQTGIHQWLLDNPAGCIVFDLLYYSFPAIYWFCCVKRQRLHPAVVGIPWLVFNWVYILCYVMYPSNSIEGHIAGLLLPFVFMQHKLPSFYYLLSGARYVFLFFFASAGLWKLRTGSLFEMEHMSAVLLVQHKEFLVAYPGHWYTEAVYFLVKNPVWSQSLFIISTVIELVFIAGFFTKRFDRILFWLFVLFLIADFWVMRIPYFGALPLALTLLYLSPRKTKTLS
ncbi:MAG TPA: hypothetical protein PKC69_08070 [Chitinophagaceae bacterium]|nr:hypothetical protein [Chitinophagaceae bacterium]